MTTRNGTASARFLAQVTCILLTFVGLWSTAAQAQTLVSNVDKSFPPWTISAVNFDHRWSQPFHTGGAEGGYTVDSVVLRFGQLNNHVTIMGEGLAVTIRESIPSTGNRGHPGAVLYTLTNPSSFRHQGLNEFTAPAGATLAANTRYHVVMEYLSSLAIVDWANADPGMDPESADDWRIFTHSYVQTRSGAENVPWPEDRPWTFRTLVRNTIRINGTAGPAEPRPTVSGGSAWRARWMKARTRSSE